MEISTLTKKLRLQNLERGVILNSPDGFLDSSRYVPGELSPRIEKSVQYDFAHLFIENKVEMIQFVDRVLEAIAYDAIFWISYPKDSSGVETDEKRDTHWADLLEKKIRAVTQVSIDDVWSAIRFRPADAVGK